MDAGIIGNAEPPASGRSTIAPPIAAVAGSERGSRPATTIAKRAMTRSVAMTNCSCQPHSMFSQLPRLSRTSGKKASTTDVRPRTRRATRTRAAAIRPSSRMLQTIPTRKSWVARTSTRYDRRASGNRCSLF